MTLPQWKLRLSAIMGLAAAILIMACGNGFVETLERYFIRRAFDYATNDINLAQAQTPFTLTFPSKLPKGFDGGFEVIGPLRPVWDSFGKPELLHVRVTYSGSDSKLLWIDQTNTTFSTGAGLIKVIRSVEVSYEEGRFTSGSDAIEIFAVWTSNGVNFLLSGSDLRFKDVKSTIESIIDR